jgi:dihydrofolate synthase/folylpolyglutamate synthase
MNAALAIAMLRHQTRISIPDGAIRAAMGWTDWPARLQRLADGPVSRLAPPGSTIWIDGCHNPASAQVIAAQIADLIEPASPLHIITGILANKDAPGILGPFCSAAAQFHTVSIPDHPCHTPEALALWLCEQGSNASAAQGVGQAIEAIAARSDKPVSILILGSLYLAGEVLNANGQRPD